MKKFILMLALISINSHATKAFTSHSIPSNGTEDLSANMGKVLYTNEANDLIYIDFENITSDLKKVNVLQNGRVIMVDDVTEMPQNSIYELELTIFQPGQYSLQLVTENEKIIHSLITIE